MSNPSDDMQTFAEALQAVQRLIHFFGDRGVIIGGVAVSLLAKPRFTADVDAILLFDIANIDQLLAQAVKEGMKPRTTDAVAFAQQTRVVPLVHELSQTNIDISLGVLPFEEEAVDRATVYQTAAFSVRLPSVEDLIILKAIAHRPKDLLDIQTLIETHPKLDVKRIESRVRDFADALETPELWEDVANLLPRQAQRRKRSSAIP